MAQELQWQQKGNEVLIDITSESGEEITFVLNKNIINLLAGNTPKFYIFSIKIGTETEKEFFADFNGLRSVSVKTNSLKITLGTKKKSGIPAKYRGLQPVGRYSIARGESFYERYLSDDGWVRQKPYFDLYNDRQVGGGSTQKPEIKENKNTSGNLSTKKQGGIVQNQPAYKTCPTCKNEISAKFETCPYCGAVHWLPKLADVDVVV